MTYLENIHLNKWIEQETPEIVIEPQLPIVDPHHHLWDIRKFTRNPHARFLQKVYLCEEFSKDIYEGGHNVFQTVFAECNAFYRTDGPDAMKCIGETEVIHGITSMSSSGLYGKPRLCAGIFGTADLTLGKEVESVLQAHMAASPNFRGIRSPFPKNLNAKFLDGYRLLGKYKLTYDNYSPDYERLPILAKLARKVPDVPIIVNHLGGKIIPDDVQKWRECVKTIANCPNAFMKTGGPSNGSINGSHLSISIIAKIRSAQRNYVSCCINIIYMQSKHLVRSVVCSKAIFQLIKNVFPIELYGICLNELQQKRD